MTDFGYYFLGDKPFAIRAAPMDGRYFWWVPDVWLEDGYRRRHWRPVMVSPMRAETMVALKPHPFWKRRK